MVIILDDQKVDKAAEEFMSLVMTIFSMIAAWMAISLGILPRVLAAYSLPRYLFH
jgi:hypothetical protein